MPPKRHIPVSTLCQALFGLLLVGWPVLDTGPVGAVTPLRIGLGCGMLLLLVTALFTAGCRRQPLARTPTDWAVSACTGWFVLNLVLVGRGHTDPYPLLTGFVFLTTYVFCRVAGTTQVLPAMLVSGFVQAGIATAQLGGVVATRHSYYDFTGSFPNPGPLGGWLCAGALAAVTLTVRLWQAGRYKWALLCAAGGLYIGAILLLTDSRAAWVSFIIGGIYFWWTFRFPRKCVHAVRLGRAATRGSKTWGNYPPDGVPAAPSGRPLTRRLSGNRLAWILLAGLGIGGAVWLYSYKKDSADGRLLIWRVSADMIAQRPVTGHGVGTFAERYMFAQADFFRRHPDSRFAAVADQTSYPFNQFIGTACEQGVIGAFLLLGLVGSAWWKGGNVSGKILLIGLVVFGLFSYPSVFPSFGLLFAALLADCVNGPGTEGKGVSRKTAARAAGTALLVGAALLSGMAARRNSPDSRYARIREASDLMRRHDPSDLPRLEELARRLPIAGFYTDLGDSFLHAGDAAKAKVYYTQAARMIPSRLRPWDGLLRACRQAGQPDSATVVARHILGMPVKVSNTATLRIRQEAEEWLERASSPVGPQVGTGH